MLVLIVFRASFDIKKVDVENWHCPQVDMYNSKKQHI